MDLQQLGIRRRQEATGKVTVTADMALGQFFFLYRAEIVETDSTVRHGFEFLHATFGEFLVARSLARALDQAITSSRYSMALDAAALPKMVASYLGPYLAYKPLVRETQLVEFLQGLSRKHVKDPQAVSPMLLDFLHDILNGFRWSSEYQPFDLSPVTAAAVWSVNLVILAVTAGRPPIQITREVLGKERLVGWRRLVQLWKSQLDPDDWNATINLFTVALASDGIAVVSAHHTADSFIPTLNLAVIDGIRLLLEARLLLDVTLEAAASAWIASVKDLSMGGLNVEPSTIRLVGRALRIANGEEWTGGELRSFLRDLRRELGSGWDDSLIRAGSAGWSDTFLISLARDIISENVSQDSSKEGIYRLRILSSVLRELIGRGFPDLAHEFLHGIRGVALAEESEFSDTVFLIQAAYAYDVTDIRYVVARAISAPWRFEEMAELMGMEVLQWFVKGTRVIGRRGVVRIPTGTAAVMLQSAIWDYRSQLSLELHGC